MSARGRREARKSISCVRGVKKKTKSRSRPASAGRGPAQERASGCAWNACICICFTVWLGSFKKKGIGKKEDKQKHQIKGRSEVLGSDVVLISFFCCSRRLARGFLLPMVSLCCCVNAAAPVQCLILSCLGLSVCPACLCPPCLVRSFPPRPFPFFPPPPPSCLCLSLARAPSFPANRGTAHAHKQDKRTGTRGVALRVMVIRPCELPSPDSD